MGLIFNVCMFWGCSNLYGVGIVLVWYLCGLRIIEVAYGKVPLQARAGEGAQPKIQIQMISLLSVFLFSNMYDLTGAFRRRFLKMLKMVRPT